MYNAHVVFMGLKNFSVVVNDSECGKEQSM